MQLLPKLKSKIAAAELPNHACRHASCAFSLCNNQVGQNYHSKPAVMPMPCSEMPL